MEPYQYVEYSKIFDSLAGQDLFPILNWFTTSIVLPRLKPASRVTDIGAGTGFFCATLLEHLPNLKLTLIEPSPEMIHLAKERLANRVEYIESTIDSAIDSLPQQDAFIFQRSLYVIYQNEIHCKTLLKKLHDKLSEEGIVFIQDFDEKINIADFKSYLLDDCAKTPEQKLDLTAKYTILEKFLILFNQRVDAGEYHLFPKDEMESLMCAAGFVPLVSGDECCYAFQRVKKI